MRRGSERIDEEQVCIDSLVQYLTGLDRCNSIKAEREEDDPPDYWFTVNDHRFAAEITSIVTDQAFDARCESLHNSIKSHCDLRPPCGTFCLVFSRRPRIPNRSSQDFRNLIADAVGKIDAMAFAESHTEAPLYQDTNGRITIVKLSAEGSTIGRLRSPEAKWEGESQDQLFRLMKDAIEKKRSKIEKKGVMRVCPDVILLFYDAYGYGDIADAAQALARIKDYDWLHSINWAASFSNCRNVMYPESPGRAGGFLYSKNEIWRTV